MRAIFRAVVYERAFRDKQVKFRTESFALTGWESTITATLFHLNHVSRFYKDSHQNAQCFSNHHERPLRVLEILAFTGHIFKPQNHLAFR